MTALNCFKKLFYPFKHDLPYFILLWSIISLPAFYQKLVYPEYFSSTLVLIFYVVTYILVVLLNLNQYAAKILKPIVFVLYTLLSIVNIYCIYMYNCWFSNDYVEIIKGTTIDKTKEYIEAYISITMIAFAILFLGLLSLIYKLTAKIKLKPHNVIVSLAFIPLFVTPIGIWQHPDVLDVVFTGKFTWSHDDIFDLSKHSSHPHVNLMFSDHPLTVIIIGESFTPSHSSLYGYAKATNPLLQEKQENGDLIVFPKATSPKTYTTATFRYLLNTYQLGMEMKCKWYESANLIEVVKSIGYHTVWISNAMYGWGDNEITGHAKICDKFALTKKDDEGHKYDGELLKCKISQKDKPLAVFYHLLGQHYQYSERYPDEYDRFKPTDYPEYTDEVAKVIAAYDNATLYNDYVVNSLIEKYQNDDAVIFYLSDHGEDVYETDPNYYGHAKNTPESQIVGKKIPFIVYLSPKYQQLHPETTARIKQSVDKEFCTDKLIYAVMDAIECKFADNVDVEKYSLFVNN